MRITQGTFSFLPDLSDAQIVKQIDHCLARGWAIGIEYAVDPHPRNPSWEMFGNPMFDIGDAAGVMLELKSARKSFPSHYIRLSAFESTHGTESVVLSFIVNRPAAEPGFRLIRTEEPGRTVRYAIESYSVQRAAEGARY